MSAIMQLKNEYLTRAINLDLHPTVLFDGRFDSTIAIVGEGAGETEVQQGLPFVGMSGKKMFEILRTQGITRIDVFATNVMKRQISTAKNPKHPVPKDEVVRWRDLLKWELQQLPKLKYVLAAGNFALEALTGLDGITHHRGSVYDCPYLPGVKVVPTFNPAHILREPANEIIFMMDCRTFRRVIDGDWQPETIEHIINPTYKEALDYIAKLKSDQAPVSFDIETTAYETACFGIANCATEAMCINLRDGLANRFTMEEELEIRFAIEGLAQTTRFVAQNGNFDTTWCGYKDRLHVPIWFDTLLAHHTLYPLLPHGLGFLVSQYTNHPYYKDEREIFKEGGDIDGFWRYNCKDAALTWKIHVKLHQELIDQRLDKFFFNHVMRLDPHLARTTVDGLAVDTTVKNKIAAALSEDLTVLLHEFHDRVQEVTRLPDYYPNPFSSAQLQRLYLHHLKLKSITGSTDASQRSKWMEDPRVDPDAKAIIQLNIKLAQEKKFASTYANMQIDPDQRVRYIYTQTGVSAAPGRLSSRQTLWGSGTNMQNQPNRAHEFYISDPGTVMFYFDLSQAEARYVAYDANIESWKEDFERARIDGSYDCHRSLASTMFKIPYDEVPKEDWDSEGSMTVRYKAKRCRHGLNYRMSFERLAEVTGMSIFEAKKCYIIYHNETPELKRWWQQLEIIAKTKRELWTPMGRRLKLLQRLDSESLKSIVAFRPQSTIGDKVKQVWYQCHEDNEWDMSKMRIKLNIHDALIGIAHPDHVMKALQIAKKYVEAPIMVTDAWNKTTDQLIIPADFKVSVPDDRGIHRWSTLQKVKVA